MEENLFQNYSNDTFDYDNINKYVVSEQYLNDENKKLMPGNNTRYYNSKIIKGYISNSNINERPNQFTSNNYKKKFLHDSLNNNLNINNNYVINNHNYNKRMPFYKTIKPNGDENIINDPKLNSNIEYNNMNKNKNSINKKKGLYSSINPVSKNFQNKFSKENRNDINKNIDIENSVDLNKYNINNKEYLLDKKEFIGHIKEINDLDNIDLDSEDVLNNNLIFKNNNIFIKENKNIYLNDLNKNKNYHMKNISEKKEINNYNRINMQSKNISKTAKQKNINTEKKDNLLHSKIISGQIINNNLSGNNLKKNSNPALKDDKDAKNQNLIDNNNKYNQLSIQNNYNTYTKLEDNNNIKLRNSNYNKYEKKFSENINISPTQKRFSTLTKEEFGIKSLDNEEDIQGQLINQKNINSILRKNIEYMKTEMQKKNNLIKKLYFQNDKLKNIIQKIKADKDSQQKINKDLLTKLNNYKNEIILLKNKAKYNLDNNNLLKNKYIREINSSKEKLRKYQNENNNLKILLIKNKERQYSTDISKNNIYNSFINYDELSRDNANYRDFNKSMSISKTKNRLNIPIFKKYKEDILNYENKSSNDNFITNLKFSTKE